jgi:hypothetical protein
MKEVDNSASFAAGGNINRRAHYNSQHRDKNKHLVTSYKTVYKTICPATLPSICKLSLAPAIEVLNNQRLLSE